MGPANRRTACGCLACFRPCSSFPTNRLQVKLTYLNLPNLAHFLDRLEGLDWSPRQDHPYIDVSRMEFNQIGTGSPLHLSVWAKTLLALFLQVLSEMEVPDSAS
jgi:hypothetical protein